MTDLDRAVERVAASISFWVDRHGYSAAHIEAPDLRLILSALRQRGEEVERERRRAAVRDEKICRMRGAYNSLLADTDPGFKPRASLSPIETGKADD